MPQQVTSGRSFLSTSEAHEKTGLSPRYIQRLLQEGRLEGFKATIWFVYEDSLSAFVAKPRKRGPKGARQKPVHSQLTAPSEAENEKKAHTGGRPRSAEGQ